MTFIKEPPLRMARRISDKELIGRATDVDVTWLHEHPVWWLRALVEAERDINNRVAQGRVDVTSRKPAPGEDQRVYLEAKTAYDVWARLHLRAKRRVERRKADVVSLFGLDHPTTRGDVVRVLVEIAAALDEDDVTSARDIAMYWAEQLGKEAS